jgi:hypothetical protein
LIVADIAEQERIVESVTGLFDNVIVADRRERPSFGYRAVHLIVRRGTKLVEVQVRTALQQRWAELSEKLADLVDPAIKYGGGEPAIQGILMRVSAVVATEEELESEIFRGEKLVASTLERGDRPRYDKKLKDLKLNLSKARRKQGPFKESTLKTMEEIIDIFSDTKGGADVVSD